jgi:hypothetical protein
VKLALDLIIITISLYNPLPAAGRNHSPNKKEKKGKRNYYIFSLIAYGIMNVMIKSLQVLSVKFISYPLTLICRT